MSALRIVWAMGAALSSCSPQARRPPGAPVALPADPVTPAPTPDPAVAEPPAAVARPPATARGIEQVPYLVPVRGPGYCAATADRQAPAPQFATHRNCTRYRGCPPHEENARADRCPSGLTIVTVRALNAEGGVRRKDSPIALRGMASVAPRFVESRRLEEEQEVKKSATCLPIWQQLMLTTEDTGLCRSAWLQPPEGGRQFFCEGDATDACCHANPSLPPLNTPAVAIGRYLGIARSLSGDDIDVILLERFCTLPPEGKESSTP